MDERQGLPGALPAGNKWRAQGYIDGNTRYLGTFDTEEDASRVFLHEKERVESLRRSEAEAAVDRILSGPTYVYEGGKGRGAQLNGQRFKVIEASGPHQVEVVPVLSDGTLGFDAKRSVLLAYLREEPKPITAEITVQTEDTPPPRAPKAALTPTDPSLKDDVLRFIHRVPNQDNEWALHFLTTHGRPNTRAVTDALVGRGGVAELVNFLRDATDVPESVLHTIEQETLGHLYMNDEARAAKRALPRVFPEACSANAGYDLEVEFRSTD